MSFFGLFSKKEPPLPSYYGVSTDMHSHLIPGIDDGAKDLKESVELVKELKRLGFKKLITTPHIMSDYYRNTPENILSGLSEVRDALAFEGIEMELEAAAEYYFDDGLIRKLDNEQLLTFSGKHLLFEISYINCPDNINEVVFKMQVQGYKPVLAHPERYPFWHNNFEKYHEFHDLGVLLQLNINSLSGYYGHEAKRTAERMIDEGIIDLVGTDCHHQRHIQALKNGLSEKYMKKVLKLNLLNTAL